MTISFLRRTRVARSPLPRPRTGFTLIELLIVIVVLGILTAIAIASFGPSQGAALTQTLREDVQHLAAGAEAYYATTGNTYTGATVAALNVTMSAGNTASIVGTPSATAITVKASNSAANMNCQITLGTTTSGPTCATGP